MAKGSYKSNNSAEPGPTFHYQDKKVYVGLYKKYIWPHMEFAALAWSPWAAGDASLLDEV
jgi:hypothetical protein